MPRGLFFGEHWSCRGVGRLCPIPAVPGAGPRRRRCRQAQWHLVTNMSSKSVETSLPSPS